MKAKSIAITALIPIVTIPLISCVHATQSQREPTKEGAALTTPGNLSGAPGDYRPLEADDPRVRDALVIASIDGFPGSFALDKTSSGWLISGWLEPDQLQE